MEFAGQQFEFLRASDVERDGMYLEAYSPTYANGKLVADVFYSDDTGKAVFTAHEKDLPIELVQFMVSQGLAEITPTVGQSDIKNRSNNNEP